ncbi:MAG: geranylgeranyl reductase family protein [Acidimicrobiales bacterium]
MPSLEGADRLFDVLVVGAGPSGSSCAYWLARAGWDVVVVEKKEFPRDKTCGDGLTPRAVRQLADMGLEEALAGAHRYRGLRSVAFGRTLELPWPKAPGFPTYGYTITRHDLDALVAQRAQGAGATVLQGTEALGPLEPWGAVPESKLAGCAGAVVASHGGGAPQELRARYVVVADGANSRFGRALGTARNRSYPQGMALRGYYTSDRHDDPMIESHLDIKDEHGDVVPGYGWIFPLGDGRVNVGVGLLSTEARWKGLNTSRLMDAFVRGAPESWGIKPENACGTPTGGRLPMGMSVGPKVGRNTLVVGDAGGMINPFNGEGISYGYETGRLAAHYVAEALLGEGEAALDAYQRHLNDAYGTYYLLGRSFVRLVSDPKRMTRCVSAGMHSAVFMGQLMRIMANLMRPETPGVAEAGYRALLGLAGLYEPKAHKVPLSQAS